MYRSLSDVLRNIGRFKGVEKWQFEIVVTRFDEDLAWTAGLEHLITVYNKGLPFPPGHSFSKVKEVPNHGVGCETILRHCMEEYDSLAEITLFSQATLCDREDQPMFELYRYFSDGGPDKIVGIKTMSYDPPTSRFQWRISNPSCKSINDRNLGEFRRLAVKQPYRFLSEDWVKGDWISVGRNKIQKWPKKYYVNLYAACAFERGILVEECWFLERSFYSIFSK